MSVFSNVVRKIITMVIFFAVLFPALHASASDGNVTGIEIIDYGIFVANRLGKLPLSSRPTEALGVYNINTLKLSKKTDRVPASFLNKFGIRYKVLGSPPEAEVRLTVKVLTPGLKKYEPEPRTVGITSVPDVIRQPTSVSLTNEVRWTSRKSIGETTYDGFVFEKDWELVPGKWTIQIYFEERLLGEKVFEVYKPKAATVNSADFLQSEIGKLSTTECGERRDAALQLATMGTKAGPAIPYLIQLLKYFVQPNTMPLDCGSGDAAVQALAGIGPASIKPLLATLSDSDWRVREGAKAALARIGKKALAPLIAALGNDTDWQIRLGAAEVLGEFKDERAATALIGTLGKDLTPAVRRKAAEILGNLKDRRALQPLAAAVVNEQENWAVRCAAVEALAKLGDQKTSTAVVIRLLEEQQGQENDLVREVAGKFLGLKEPEQSTEVLRQRLNSANATERSKALVLLAERNDPAAQERTLADLHHPDSSVRRDAVSLLTGTADPRGFEPVLGMLSDKDSQVRFAVINALARFNDARAVLPITDLLNDSDRDVRCAAVRALAVFHDDRCLQAIMAAVSDKDSYVRKQVITSLVEFNDPRVVSLLIGVTKGTDQGDGYEAGKSLGKMGEVAVLPLIESFRGKGADPHTAGSSATANYASGGNSFGGGMVTLSQGKPNSFSRGWRIEALVAIGKPASEALIAALRDNDPLVRKSVAEVLGKLREERAVVPLIETFSDYLISTTSVSSVGKIGEPAVEALLARVNTSDARFRREVVKALGETGSKRALSPLIEALNDQDFYTRINAAEGLGKIKDARAVPPLIKTLKDNDAYVRHGAIEALGQLGSPKALNPLTALLSSDPKNNHSTLVALGKLKDKRATKDILPFLKDSHPQLRWMAVEALGSIGDALAVAPLIDTLDDSNRDVKWAALRALKGITGKEFSDDPSAWKLWRRMAKR